MKSFWIETDQKKTKKRKEKEKEKEKEKKIRRKKVNWKTDGVVSKKDIGALKIFCKSPSWRTVAALIFVIIKNNLSYESIDQWDLILNTNLIPQIT